MRPRQPDMHHNGHRQATLRLSGIAATTILIATTLTSPTSPAEKRDLVVTSRPCTADQLTSATPGPACLLAHQELGELPANANYWHIDTFATEEAAMAAASPRGTVVRDFGKVWLFTIDTKNWRAAAGTHIADIGPLPIKKAASFSAEYVHSLFTPGMTAPVHKHSGPEGFYAIDGDTCLEMPGGVDTGIGPGNSLVMEGGPPMLLMAVGTTPRRAFALVLHDASQPATTRAPDWKPRGLCNKYLPDGGDTT